MTELKTLESRHTLDPNNLRLKNSMSVIKTELQTILHEENKFALFQLRRQYLESGDEAAKMLPLRKSSVNF